MAGNTDTREPNLDNEATATHQQEWRERTFAVYTKAIDLVQQGLHSAIVLLNVLVASPTHGASFSPRLTR